MTTAIQVGLVPGFALQDGDKLAQLLGGGGVSGSFGLGSTANQNTNLSSTGNNTLVGASLIGSSVTVVGTTTTTNNSVQLAQIPPTTMLRIYNTTANPIYVFPPTGQTIDSAPLATAVVLSGGARCDYLYLGNNAWRSDLLGSPSA